MFHAAAAARSEPSTMSLFRGIVGSPTASEASGGEGAVRLSFDGETVRSHGVDPDTVQFLAKPYSAEDLLREVREALGEE